jgi:hypothetical protein
MKLRKEIAVLLVLAVIPAMVFAGGQREDRDHGKNEPQEAEASAESESPEDSDWEADETLDLQATIQLGGNQVGQGSEAESPDEMDDEALIQQYADQIISLPDAITAGGGEAGADVNVLGAVLSSVNGSLVYELELSDRTTMYLDAADGRLLHRTSAEVEKSEESRRGDQRESEDDEGGESENEEDD